MVRFLSVLVLLMLPLVARGAELDPKQPYSATRAEPVTYHVDFRVIVTAPQGTKQLRVWVPVPPSDRAQEVKPTGFETFPVNVKPAMHTEREFGNTFAYFEFANPQGAQIITHTFRATVWELNWDVDPAKVMRVEKWPASFDPYRRSESQVVVNEKFKKLANEIAGNKPNPAAELREILSWTHKNLTYDHSNASLVGSAEHAFSKKRGDCSDYHGLCASLGRSLGLPTRVTYGLHLFPKNLPGHCKLEAFLPPYGWVSFDVSETQRLIKLIEASPDLKPAEKVELAKSATERLRKGFRDNTWLMHSKGTDYELAPKASQKVPLVASIFAEADGKALPLPDPADPKKNEFAWMTAHKFTPNREVSYPFREWKKK
ncbi:MAG: transglutaminase domain-containing protein [Planctomycetia bacterium]|nr:transglutaminase domain-containing protein [Planctomycetia bacterium]